MVARTQALIKGKVILVPTVGACIKHKPCVPGKDGVIFFIINDESVLISFVVLTHRMPH